MRHVVRLSFAMLLVLNACGGSPGAEGNGFDSCTCDITMNGASKSLTCGETACVNGTKFACEKGGSIGNQGACKEPAETREDEGNTSKGGTTTGGTKPPGDTAAPENQAAVPAFVAGADLVINGKNVHFSRVISPVGIHGTGSMFLESPTVGSKTWFSLKVRQWNISKISCDSRVEGITREARGFLKLPGALSDFMSEFTCQVTLSKSCIKDGYIQGTITGMELTNNEDVKATVAGTFTTGCE